MTSLVDTMELLHRIETKIDELNSDSTLSELEPRMEVEPGEPRFELLDYISENEPVTVADIEHVADTNPTRVLTTLYRAYAANREKNNEGNYEYTITELGEQMLDTDQSRISDACQPSKPWEEHDVSKTEYHALESIAGAKDSPRSRDVNESFVEKSVVAAESCKGPAITPYLTELTRDGYLDRTPKPYRYWITEKGAAVLND